MLKWVYLSVVLLAIVPIWSQVVSPVIGSNGDEMITPPPVSGEAYSTEVGSETRSNYLRGGLIFETAYINNLYPGNGTPISETTYSILPTISFDQTTARYRRRFTYSPGFIFYQPSSALNEIDHNALLAYRYRLTPHASVSVSDSFQKSQTSFGLAHSSADWPVSGSPPLMVPGIVAPFGERVTNNAAAQFAVQYSLSGMIGGSGTFMKLYYPDPAEVSGLYDADERGGSAFYSRRISPTQYAGANYQYARILAYPVDAPSETQTHAIYAFYTIYPTRGLSISISGGSQHYSVAQTSSPTTSSWEPIVMASIGWQGRRTNVAASYVRQTTAGGGVVGAYRSNSANASGRWQVSRTWTIGTGASYANNKSVNPLLVGAIPGGRSFAVVATVEHPLNRRITLGFNYDHEYQRYNDIPVFSSNPTSDRGMVSLSWQFTRPLGR